MTTLSAIHNEKNFPFQWSVPTLLSLHIPAILAGTSRAVGSHVMDHREDAITLEPLALRAERFMKLPRFQDQR